MYVEALKYHSVVRRAQRDLYYEYGVTSIELELLTSLGMLIIERGKIWHGREKIMRRAFKPVKSAQFYAAMHAIVEKNLVTIKIYNKDKLEALTLSIEGLTIIERFDMRINELFKEAAAKDQSNKTIHEIIKGSYN